MTKIRLVKAFVLALEAITASLAEAFFHVFFAKKPRFLFSTAARILKKKNGYTTSFQILTWLSVCWSVGRFFKCHSCRIWKSFAASQTLKIYLQRMIHCVAWNMGNAKMFPVHLEISQWTDFARKLTHSFSGFHRLVDKLFDFKLKKDPAEAIEKPIIFWYHQDFPETARPKNGLRIIGICWRSFFQRRSPCWRGRKKQ